MGVGKNSDLAVVNLLVANWIETRPRSTGRDMEEKRRLRNYVL